MPPGGIALICFCLSRACPGNAPGQPLRYGRHSTGSDCISCTDLRGLLQWGQTAVKKEVSMIYSQVESLPRDQLRKLQDERLRQMVGYVYERVPFYQEQLNRLGLKPADIRSVDDLPKLPFTQKRSLKDQYPFGLLAVPREQVIRVHASSGTTGKPTVVSYTRRDIDLFAEVMARSFVAAGARPGMLLHNGYGYGLFTGGLGTHYGGERLGMTVVPVSGGMTERQITLILDLKPEVLCCTPSYAQTLAEEFKKLGIAPDEMSLKHGLFGAEPWTEAIRADIETQLGLTATNLYGLSEIIGPGVSTECIEARSGSHIWEDHFYPEVVDPTSGEPLPDGKEGVLVLTPDTESNATSSLLDERHHLS